MSSLTKRGGAHAAGPGQLALVMPIAAVIGLMVVVSAAALGGSAHLVAILAVGGFALCAIAPMALLEVFVARPLRAAAERLRAARDGRPIPEETPRASGLVADLVLLADDVRAAHAHLSQYGSAISQCEKLAVAGDEAIRAFRLHSEELAEATALGESQLRRASQSQFTEIAEALKALRSALPTNFEGAVERIESMLVYIGESFDRRESKDKIFESAFGRVDRSFADLGRLMAQETQNLQANLASATASLREDLAGAHKAASAELGLKIETAETRVLAKLFDLEAPDAARLIEAMRAESETTRRALREKIEQLLAVAAPDRLTALERLTAEGFEATARKLDALPTETATRDDIQAVTGALARLEASVPPSVDITELTATSEALAVQVARLENVAPTGQDQQWLAVAKLTASLHERVEATEARLAEPLAALRRDSLERFDALAGAAETLRAGIEDLAGKIEAGPVDLGPVLERVEAAAQAQIGKLSEVAAALDPRETLERLETGIAGLATILADAGAGPDLAAFGEALTALREGLAAAAQAQTAGDDAGQEHLASLFERLDALGADIKTANAETGSEGARLRAEIAALGDLLGEALGSLISRLDDAAKAEDLRQALDVTASRVEAAAQAQNETLQAVSAALTAQDPREAVAGLAANIEAVQTALTGLADRPSETEALRDLVSESLDATASRIETAQSQNFAGLAAAIAEARMAIEGLAAKDRASEMVALGERLREALETTTSRVEAAIEAQGERLWEVSAALLTQDPRDALAGLAGAMEAVQATIAEQAASDRMALDTTAQRVETALQDQVERLGMVWDLVSTQDPRETLTSLAGSLAQLQSAIDALAGADRAVEALALGERLGEAREAVSRLEETTRREAERLRADIATVAEAVPDSARLMQENLAESVRRFEIHAAASGEETRAAFASLGTEIAGLAQSAREHSETLGALDASAQRSGADAQARSELAAAALAQAAADLAVEIRAAAQAQTQALAALDRDLFAGPLAALEATAGRLDIAADALTAERADVNGLRSEIAGAASVLADRVDALAQGEFVPAVASLTALNQDICKTATQLSASANALRIAVAGERPAFKELRDDVAGLAGALGTAARFIEERFDGLDGRLAQQGQDDLDRLQSLSPPSVAAEVLARIEALAQAQEERLDALELRLATRGAPFDRNAVASALTAFRAMGQSLRDATERLQKASEAVEAKAEALPYSMPDLSFLAQATAASDGRLESLGADPALIEVLRGVGAEITGALAGFASRLDRAAEEAPALREAFEALNARMAEALAEIGRRGPAVVSATGSEAKSPNALAKIVVSLADSLDFRFGQIEHGLLEVAAQWRDNVASNEDAIAAEMNEILKQINSASEILKAGLSNFMGVSVELVENTGPSRLVVNG